MKNQGKRNNRNSGRRHNGNSKNKNSNQNKCESDDDNNPNRSFFDRIVSNKSSSLLNSADAFRFFDCALKFKDILDLLNILTDRQRFGREALKAAFSLGCVYDDANNTLNNGVIKFLAFLGSTVCNIGATKSCTCELYLVAYNTPRFIEMILNALQNEVIVDVVAVAWFIVEIAVASESARENPLVHSIASILGESQCPATQALLTISYPAFADKKLNSNLSKSDFQFSSLEQFRSLEHQHDNDFPFDFRKVSIIPTPGEINYMNPDASNISKSWDPDASNISKSWDFHSINDESIPISREGDILDRQFRLLREDMIAPMKEEIRTEMLLPMNKRRRTFSNPHAVGIELKPRPCILIRVDVPQSLRGKLKGMSVRERKEFMGEHCRRVLDTDAMVLFCDETGKVKFVGVLTRRDEDELVSCAPDYFIIGVTILDGSVVEMLTMLRSSSYIRNRRNYNYKGRQQFILSPKITPLLFQASASLFSYQPVLQRLQKMVSVPFSEQLVFNSIPSIVDANKLVDIEKLKKIFGDDQSQIKAMKIALQDNVSVIQGPPGTGKSFVGVNAAKYLLEDDPETKILCICYTNHALDDFLESLINTGVSKNSIVRVGSSPNISETLKNTCLNEIDESSFDRAQSSRYGILKKEQEKSIKDIEREKQYIEVKEWGPKWWETVSEFLSSQSSEHCSALEELTFNSDTMSGTSIVGIKSKSSKGDDFWINWCKGKNKPGTGDCLPENSIWKLSDAARKVLLNKWQSEWRRSHIECLSKSLNDYNEATKEIEELRNAAKVPLLKKAKVIGCTTTSAAKISELLSLCSPTVVIVEEAAEILEAHILTSLSPSVKRLIMIGDHFQLRAKLEHYPLRKESGKLVDFDVSLFERLAYQTNFPLQQLTVQHRMRPEFSSIVRKTTYPELKDHPNVLNRKNILGVSSNLVFFSHENLESGDPDNELLGTSSKTNLFEVSMTTEIVKYLINQGYDQSDIVILTPYLGQLALIKGSLTSHNVGVDLGDLDKEDLARSEFDISTENYDENKISESDSVLKNMKNVRVATIDNYQGEESKIIIASLVHSNNNGDIGFLSCSERINVLFSRARDGFIIIGNTSCLRNASSTKGKSLWNGILNIVDEQNNLFTGFPVICQRHNNRGLVKSIESFKILCPDGGCSEQCNEPLPNCPLNHLCKKRCHPIINFRTGKNDHENILCTEIVNEQCKFGHLIGRVCSSKKKPLCRSVVRDDCSEGHFREKKCHQKSLKDCLECYRILELKKENDEILRQETEKRSVELALSIERLAKCEALREMESLAKQHEARLMRITKEKKLVEIHIEKRKKERLLNMNIFDTSSVCPTESPVAPHQQLSSVNRDIESVDGSNHDMIRTSVLNSNETITLYAQTNNDNSVAVLGENPNNIGNNNSNMTSLYLSDNNSLNSSKFLQQFFRKIEKEDWIGVYNLSQVYINEKDNSIINNKGALFHSISAIFLLSQLKLGSPVDVIQESLTSLLSSMIEISNLIIESSDQIRFEFSIAISVVYYVIIIVEDLSEIFPASVCDYSDNFLGQLCIKKKQPSDLTIPSSWIETVKNILEKNIRLIDDNETSSKKARMVTESVITASVKWERLKTGKEEFKKIKSLYALMDLTGLELVKSSFINELLANEIAKEQNLPGSSSYNTRFNGNPGTGKTIVARLYSAFLIEVEIIPKKSIYEETTGASLITLGVYGLKKILEKGKNAGGAVIFVDEAYQLNPHDSMQGREVLDFLLTHAEKLHGDYGPLVWIFAGHEKKMEKLFEHNPGLPSRFPTSLTFEDYTDEELQKIFVGLMSNKSFENTSVTAEDTQSIKKATVLNFDNSSNIRNDEVDEWGHIWKWNPSQNTFVDEFDNITGYGVSGLGSESNPLVSREDNSMWIYDRNTKNWKNFKDSSICCASYPGEQKKTEANNKNKLPFVVHNEKWIRIAIRRVGRGRGRIGFGNARAIRTLFDLTRKRQSARIILERENGFNPNIMEFIRNDLLGPSADNENIKASKSWTELIEMEGLSEVKEEIDKLLKMVIKNAELEENEKELREIALNRIFLGNPGTGKTTVAKLFGRILADLGLLSKGEIIFKNPSDFVGSALGTSEAITRSILTAAEGCVLVIDEAYGLNPSTGNIGTGGGDPYKAAVIDTIVEQVQGVPGEDRVVILLGYRKQMEAFIVAANPGLSRRFQMENAIEFKDYDDAALVRILRKRCSEKQLSIDLDTANYAIKKLSKARAQPHFGNAGAVNNLLSSAILRLSNRTKSLSAIDKRSSQLICDDFNLGVAESNEENIFQDVIGCDNVFKKLSEYKDTISYCQSQGKDPKDYFDYNFIFVGSPGTGKTTIANRMGKMFHLLGLIPTDIVVETSASELTTGYVGQAGKKTHDVLSKACGKVLFIDEAYQLNPSVGGAYMQEVVDELVKGLTSEEFKGKLIVILACYANDMEEMLSVNEGLRSRFSEKIVFENFTPHAVMTLLMNLLSKENIDISVNALKLLPSLCIRLTEADSFANGRDVHSWFKKIFRSYAQRIQREACDNSNSREISEIDLSHSLAEFIVSKAPSLASKISDSLSSKKKSKVTDFDFQKDSLMPPKIQRTEQRVLVKDEVNESLTIAADNNDIDAQFFQSLQTVLDTLGLNTKSGIAELSELSIDSQRMFELATNLASLTGMSHEMTRDKLLLWQKMQLSIREKIEEQEKEIELAKAQKRNVLVPIWRCGICGRADKPYIVCYVQPVIVRYEEVMYDDI